MPFFFVVLEYGGTSPEPPPPGVECEPLPPGVECEPLPPEVHIEPDPLDGAPIPDYSISSMDSTPMLQSVQDISFEEPPPPPPPQDDFVKLEQSPSSPTDKPQVSKSKLLLSKAMAKKRLAAFSATRSSNSFEDDRNLGHAKKSVMKLPALSDARLNEVEFERQRADKVEDGAMMDIKKEEVHHRPNVVQPSRNLEELHSSSISKPKFSLVRFTQANSPPPVITEKKGDYGSPRTFGGNVDDADKQKVVVEWKRIADKSSKSLRTKSDSVEKSDGNAEDKASHSDEGKRESSYDDKRSRDRRDGHDGYRRSSSKRDYGRRRSRSPSYQQNRRYGYNQRWYNRGRSRRYVEHLSFFCIATNSDIVTRYSIEEL